MDVLGTTGAGLLEFLEWAGTRGEINPSTARALASAVRRVLAVEPNPDDVDISSLDVDDVFQRFEMLNRTNYTTDSLKVYQSRFRNAVAMYLAWKENRSDWKTAGGWGRRSASVGSGSRTTTNGKVKRLKPPPVKSGAESSMEEPLSPGSTASEQMVPYDLPLRPGLRVRLVLPESLTRADAARISAFVNSLAFDEPEASPRIRGELTAGVKEF
jgi:hypothetical protein